MRKAGRLAFRDWRTILGALIPGAFAYAGALVADDMGRHVRGLLRFLSSPFALFVGCGIGGVIYAFIFDRVSRYYALRALPDHCRTCGYDLTANASGRCPECGSPIPPADVTGSEGGR